MSTIKAIIFDFGGVIAHFQNPDKVNKMSDAFNVTQEEFEPVYFKHRPPYDRGDTTLEEYWHAIGQDFGIPVDKAFAQKMYELDFDRWTRFDEKMLSFIKEAHNRMEKIAILSNMPDQFWHDFLANYDWANKFDEVIISGILNISKPEEEIYRRCVEKLGFQPSECLFIDDTEVNIKAAEDFGIKGYHYSTFDEFIEIYNRQFSPVTCS